MAVSGMSRPLLTCSFVPVVVYGIQFVAPRPNADRTNPAFALGASWPGLGIKKPRGHGIQRSSGAVQLQGYPPGSCGDKR